MKESEEEKKETTPYYPRYSGSYCHKKDAYLTMEVKTADEKRTLSFPGISTQTDIMLENERDGLKENIYNYLKKRGLNDGKGRVTETSS